MAATANDLTRQQLDELDALLQRMLNVPAAKAEPVPTMRIDPPAPTSPPHFLAVEAAPEITPEPLSWPLPPEPAIELVAEPQASRTSPMLWPMLAVTWSLEGVLKLFGPPGEFFTRRAGKNILATCGVLMMIGSALWTANGFGLVKLPIPKLLQRGG